jgi:SAM-dependent methyltransferase
MDTKSLIKNFSLFAWCVSLLRSASLGLNVSRHISSSDSASRDDKRTTQLGNPSFLSGSEKKQVDKSAYEFFRYCGLDRWASYHYQLTEILAVKPASVLEVGVGDGVVCGYLSRNTEITYTSVDIADDVGADVTGSIIELPFENKSFDIACAFEVLEHLPFEQLETSLSELSRVARKRVIISVPHFGPPLTLRFKLPFLPENSWNGQHYWELGKKGYPVRRFRSELCKHFTIEKEYIPFENQYHHFFVLEPKV